MSEQVIHYLVLSGGLLAVMPVLLVVTLAVGFERSWLLRRTLRHGAGLQGRLRRVGYRDLGTLRIMGETSGSTLQGHLVATALASHGETADETETNLDEEIMRATPVLLRGIWVLDTAVTIAPLLGLFGTIIGLIQTFDVLSAHAGRRKSPAASPMPWFPPRPACSSPSSPCASSITSTQRLPRSPFSS